MLFCNVSCCYLLVSCCSIFLSSFYVALSCSSFCKFCEVARDFHVGVMRICMLFNVVQCCVMLFYVALSCLALFYVYSCRFCVARCCYLSFTMTMLLDVAFLLFIVSPRLFYCCCSRLFYVAVCCVVFSLLVL